MYVHISNCAHTYVFVCMFACVYVCVRMNACMYLSMNELRMYVGMYVCKCASIHVCLIASLPSLCFLHTCMHAYVCMYACMHVCMYVCDTPFYDIMYYKEE